MTGSFAMEVERQVRIAVDYSPDPINVQDHLDSWAERHVRVRVRLVGLDDEAGVERVTYQTELECVEPPPKVERSASPRIDRVALFVVCAAYASAGVLMVGAAVGLARWMGGV